jgi:hypothetical protein
MTDDPTYTIILSLNAISRIVDELPAIGKRSELSQKAHEIALLLNEAGKAVQAMEKEIISLKYEYPAQRFERQKGVKRG